MRLNSEAALLNGAGGAARSYVSSAARKCAGARELYHVVHEGLAAERTSPGRAQPRPDLGAERRMQVDRVWVRESLFSLLSSLSFFFYFVNR